MPEKYWDDFTVGEKIVTPGVTVTEAHVVKWAGLTMDFYPIHVDQEYAAKTVFGERLVHGPLTFALAVGLMAQTNYAKDSVIAWLGVGELRALAPVKIGDTIHLEAEIVEVRETKKPEQGYCRMRYDIVNQRSETVMTFDMKFLMHKRVAN